MKDIKPIYERNKDYPFIIAGPCSAENEIQVFETAKQLKENGVNVFRAGAWKPRTRPGGFEGNGISALRWMKRVKNELGMQTITEVANRLQTELALEYDIDMIWIGARTTTSPFAVQEIVDTLYENGADIPVLIKNPPCPDLELWIGAIERFYEGGFKKLGAIHRGFTEWPKSAYRNSPIWAIPTELKKRIPNLLMIHDPSHVGGDASLIEYLSKKAINGKVFDGLMIESHFRPSNAITDAKQQITPQELNRIITEIKNTYVEPLS